MQEQVLEKGIIVNSENGFVEIELLKNDKCEECSAKLYCSPKMDSSKILRVKNPVNYQEGENVTISILGKNILKASFNLYLYPLLLLVSSIFIGTKLFTSNIELFSFLLGITITALYYILFFQLGKRKKETEPQIIIAKSE